MHAVIIRVHAQTNILIDSRGLTRTVAGLQDAEAEALLHPHLR